MKVVFDLVCEGCQRKNYTTAKNKKNTTEKVELKKYCSWCRKHTLHREKKLSKSSK